MSVDDTADEDILELPSILEAEEPEMVPLFRVDGEVYEIPKLIPAGLGLEYLERQADPQQGPDAASIWLMKEILGSEVYTLLKNHPTLDFDTFNQVFSRLEERVLGGKGATAAKQSRGRTGARRRPASKKSRGS